MIEHAKNMLAYDRWANARVLAVLEAMARPEGRPLERFAHILFAEEIWLLRITGQDTSSHTTPWPSYSVKDCRNKYTVIGTAWSAYLEAANQAELERIFVYKNTLGKEGKAKVGDVLIHVFNHSTYHRGQIATAIKQAGGEVPSTDYIAYAMEKPKS